MIYILILSVGIFRKPSFFDAALLMEQFDDAPEKSTSENAEHGRNHHGFDKQGEADGNGAGECERGPAADAEIIFGFDDDGVENADDDKRYNGDDETFEMHFTRDRSCVQNLAWPRSVRLFRHAV